MKNNSRRINLQTMTPTELHIRDSILSVEELGAHPLLTEAVILLGKAKDKVADYVDNRLETEKLKKFLDDLSYISKQHMIGITGEPVLYVMIPDDYERMYSADEASHLHHGTQPLKCSCGFEAHDDAQMRAHTDKIHGGYR